MSKIETLGSNISENDLKRWKLLPKEFVLSSIDSRPMKLDYIQFGLFSPQEIESVSEIPILNRELYKFDHSLVPYGCLDLRLGTSVKNQNCETCGLRLIDCIGHYGYVPLVFPVFHVGYFKAILAILKSICKKCCKVMLEPEEKEKYRNRLKNPRLDGLQKELIFKKIVELCKKHTRCPYCSEINGTVKKVGVLKIVHEKYKDNAINRRLHVLEEFYKRFQTAISYNNEIRNFLPKVQEDLNPLVVRELFCRISNEDCQLLWMDVRQGRPENLIITNLLVPPSCIRPSVPVLGSGSNEDDITMKITEIVFTNENTKPAIDKGVPESKLMEYWDYLQVSCAMLINSEQPGLVGASKSRPFRGYCQRLKGKMGRFRGNLSGKRVDFSGRTVISPDPNLDIDQVAVPIDMAKILTYPEMCFNHNIEKLRKLVRNGAYKHPGANVIIYPDGMKRMLLGNTEKFANELYVGCIVERHLIDGDIVLFNRQPSLHRMSIMCHRAKIQPWRTLRFNECVCTPYNADFDGDEMNIHVPQTEEARAEALILMNVIENLITPKNGEPIIAATQDFITAAYLMTRKDQFFDKSQFDSICTYAFNGTSHIEIPPPAILKPMKLWTGKQIFETMIHPNSKSRLLINMESKTKSFTTSKFDPTPLNDLITSWGSNEQLNFFQLFKKLLALFSTQLNVYPIDYQKISYSSIKEDRVSKIIQFNLKSNNITSVPFFILPSKNPLLCLASTVKEYMKRTKSYRSDHLDSDQFLIMIKEEMSYFPSFKEIQLLIGQIFSEAKKYDSRIIQSVQRTPCKYLFSSSSPPWMCPKDGWVIFRNSELLCGVLDKSVLGSGSKSTIFHTILRDFSPIESAACMSRLSRMTSRWLMNHGFSIGISDVQPSSKLTEEKQKLVSEGYQKCSEFIQQYEMGQLPLQPGCTAEQTLEAKLNKELSNIREIAGNFCLDTLHHSNAPLIMAVCGSKGSTINISQMIASVGQQIVSGNRIPNGFINRTLPHFPRGSKEPAAKGFVKNSFYTGLTATEFFFHTMGGREGLVDTAVKTAETGYMQRRLMKALEDLYTAYDDTVRNSVGGIVQFTYGDDGLDPPGMEGEEKPVDFVRLLMNVTFSFPCRNEPSCLPGDIMEIVTTQCKKMEEFVNTRFLETITAFFKNFCSDMIEKYKLLNLPIDETTKYENVKETLNSHEGTISFNLIRLTQTQISRFFEVCWKKYNKAKVEPGTAVGALGAQSIGEPGTQMTLKTFHFAGVASMNVTLGVPRIKEIINASKNISTPIITAILKNDQDQQFARVVKGRIETTTLGQIAQYIKQIMSPDLCMLVIKLDTKIIKDLCLEITLDSVIRAILDDKKIKLPAKNVRSKGKNKIEIYPSIMQKEKLLHHLNDLKVRLQRVIVKGIPGVERAVINVDKGKYNLFVEGNKLAHIMGTPGVDSKQTYSNHIMEIEKTLGIEAARFCIMKEIQDTMKAHGMTIDVRHIMLLADVMTYKGEVLGITRFGMKKMKDSVLMLASFENTTDHLFDASFHSKIERINGVSETIIMGVPVPLGTGMFKILQKSSKIPTPQRNTLFDSPKMNLNIFKPKAEI